MLEVYDATQESRSFSSLPWYRTFTSRGDTQEEIVDTLHEIYDKALAAWRAKTILSTSENDLKDFLEKSLSEVSEVQRVTISEREKSGHRMVELWVALSHSTQEVRFRVYEIEEKIMQQFTERYFDFHVFEQRDELPSGQVEVFKPRKG